MVPTIDGAAEALAIEKRRYDAMCSADTSTLEHLLHDDLSYVHSDGTTDGKKSYLAGIRRKKWVYKTIQARDQRVTMLGDTALIRGLVRLSVAIDGVPTRFEVVMLTALSRNKGQLQVIHSQGTRTPDEGRGSDPDLGILLDGAA